MNGSMGFQRGLSRGGDGGLGAGFWVLGSGGDAMLYEAIREACGKYRCCYGNDYDTALSCYCDAFAKRRNGPNPCKPSYEEAWILLSFANGWNARMTANFLDVHRALCEIEPDLEKLRAKALLDVCLDDKTLKLIGRIFEKLATCKSKERNEATGASKMLHIINPKLFVMWDGAIRSGYICKLEKKDWIWYTEFLQEMQRLAKQAVCEVMEQDESHSRETAIASLTGCKRTLAKAMDEYNFLKYTKEVGSVWKAEYEL